MSQPTAVLVLMATSVEFGIKVVSTPETKLGEVAFHPITRAPNRDAVERGQTSIASPVSPDKMSSVVTRCAGRLCVRDIADNYRG